MLTPWYTMQVVSSVTMKCNTRFLKGLEVLNDTDWHLREMVHLQKVLPLGQNFASGMQLFTKIH